MDDELEPKEDNLEEDDFGTEEDFGDTPSGKKKKGKSLEDEEVDIDALADEDDAILPEDSYDDQDPL